MELCIEGEKGRMCVDMDKAMKDGWVEYYMREKLFPR